MSLEKIKAKYGDKPVLVWTPNSDDLEKSEDCLFVFQKSIRMR